MPERKILSYGLLISFFIVLLAFVYLQIDHLHSIITSNRFSEDILKLQQHEADFQRNMLDFNHSPVEHAKRVSQTLEDATELLRDHDMYAFPQENDRLLWTAYPTKRLAYLYITNTIRKNLLDYKQTLTNRGTLHRELISLSKPLQTDMIRFNKEFIAADDAFPAKHKSFLVSILRHTISFWSPDNISPNANLANSEKTIKSLQHELNQLSLHKDVRKKAGMLLSTLQDILSKREQIRKLTVALLTSSSFEKLALVQQSYDESLIILHVLLQVYSFFFYLIAVCILFGCVFVMFRLRHATQLLSNRNRDLEEAKITAIQANRTKSVFLSNMSHELRTPMHAILNFSQFGMADINKKPVPKKEIHDHFEHIYKSGGRLLHLINNLLDLSKMEAGKQSFTFQKHNILHVIEEAVTELSYLMQEKNLAYEIKKSRTALTLEIDRPKIHQVIINLISNAIKYSPEGGTIAVKLEKTTLHNKEAISISVLDEGNGLADPKDANRIFNKFYQSTKNTSNIEGTGLGLPICKEIITHHKGRISAGNREDGKGFVIHFTLPYQQ